MSASAERREIGLAFEERGEPEPVIMNGRIFVPCTAKGCPGLFPSEEDRAAHIANWHQAPERDRESPYLDIKRLDRPKSRETLATFRTHPFRHGRKR